MAVATTLYPDGLLFDALVRKIGEAKFAIDLGTFIFNLVKHLLVGLWQFSDTQCGFKAYRQNAVRPLYERSVIDRFMFDVEILYLAERKRLRVYEMPVRWADSAGSKVRFLEGLTNMFKDLVRIRWMHRGI